MPNTDKIDLEHLKAISGNNREFIKDLLGAFLSNTPRDLQNLRTAFQSGDSAQTIYYAHKLKSSCSAMGFKKVSDTFQNIEQSLNDRAPKEEVQLFIEKVDENCRDGIIQVKIELAKYM